MGARNEDEKKCVWRGRQERDEKMGSLEEKKEEWEGRQKIGSLEERKNEKKKMEMVGMNMLGKAFTVEDKNKARGLIFL